MVYISSIGRGIPKYHVSQQEVKQLVSRLFSSKHQRLQRYLSVFDHAKVDSRQLVCPTTWYEEEHQFDEANHLYVEHALQLSLEAIDHCFENISKQNSNLPIFPYEAVDLIVFVSSTGITTPSLDAYIMNERPFREDVTRMPLWGLGCAGGAMGLGRAFEWLKLHKDKTALVVCCELCSLTLQLNDTSTSNIVGTALFGDGVAATLLIGEDSEYTKYVSQIALSIQQTHSYLKKGTTDVMGWKVGKNGLHVIFSKQIPKLIKSLWKEHVEVFLGRFGLTIKEIDTFIAHPGGRKVLEEMETSCHIPNEKISYSYEVLRNHGNISSATVIYVLKKWLEEKGDHPLHQPFGLLSALGPGFSSELLLLKWVMR